MPLVFSWHISALWDQQSEGEPSSGYVDLFLCKVPLSLVLYPSDSSPLSLLQLQCQFPQFNKVLAFFTVVWKVPAGRKLEWLFPFESYDSSYPKSEIRSFICLKCFNFLAEDCALLCHLYNGDNDLRELLWSLELYLWTITTGMPLI